MHLIKFQSGVKINIVITIRPLKSFKKDHENCLQRALQLRSTLVDKTRSSEGLYHFNKIEVNTTAYEITLFC